MSSSLWSMKEYRNWLASAPPAHADGFYAMYGSQWDAVVTDPRLMSVPVDDHLAHRGDGVFETLLCEGGALYNLEAHLRRLAHSADSIGLDPPVGSERLREIILDTFRVSGRPRALGRLLLGRGPGGFSVDPNESPRASLYLVVYQAPAPFMERVPEGAKAVLSSLPPKSGGLANIKTCNYLTNALMKAEAARAGSHFAFGVDADGFLTESFTENLAAVDKDGALLIPPATHHLPGTTLARVAELAAESGREVRERKLRPESLFDLSETLVVGTTAYVTRVVELDGRALPTGPVWAELAEALRRDIGENGVLRTPVTG